VLPSQGITTLLVTPVQALFLGAVLLLCESVLFGASSPGLFTDELLSVVGWTRGRDVLLEVCS